MNDKFVDFVKLFEKVIRFPKMTLSEKETELVKDILVQLLDNNPHYGPQTKQVFKEIFDNTKDFKTLTLAVQSYILTHDISL